MRIIMVIGLLLLGCESNENPEQSELWVADFTHQFSCDDFVITRVEADGRGVLYVSYQDDPISPDQGTWAIVSCVGQKVTLSFDFWSDSLAREIRIITDSLYLYQYSEYGDASCGELFPTGTHRFPIPELTGELEITYRAVWNQD
jgi:hypothetical protein